MGLDNTHWIFWMILAGAVRGVRTFYLEFKIGELLGKDSLETRMLDEVCREMVRKTAKPMLAVNLAMIGMMVLSWNLMPPRESAVVFLFTGIVLSCVDLLKECEERRALTTAAPLRLLLWRLHVLTGVGFVFNIISAYLFSASGLN